MLNQGVSENIMLFNGIKVSVFFRLHQIFRRQKCEITFFYLIWSCFEIFCSKFSQMDEKIVLYIKYFWEHRRKGRIQNQPNYVLLHFLDSFEKFNF